MSLPPPSQDQAYCDVSALIAGMANSPLAWALEGVSDDVFVNIPSLCFLVRHRADNDTLLLDLGIRKDWATGLPPLLVQFINEKLKFETMVPEDIVEALAKGGLKPSDIAKILFSHVHFDHVGDPSLFPTSQFFSGEGSRPLVEDGYPKNPRSVIPQDTLPADRTTYLNPEGWPAIGPFPHALDFYGDGSTYVIDAGHGHIPGHMNLLVRTSADGGWVYLAGDTAHDWRIIKGEAKIGRSPLYGCAHLDVAAAEEHIGRVRTLMADNPRVKVLLAHDAPWLAENKDGSVLWPGKIPSL